MVSIKWTLPLVLLPVLFACCYFGIRDSKYQPISIQVLQSDGTPAAGVRVGQLFFNTGPDIEDEQLTLTLLGDDSNRPTHQAEPPVTDQNGEVIVTRDQIFYSGDPRKRVVLAVTEDERQMGLVVISPSDRFGSLALQLQSTTTVEIAPKSQLLLDVGKELEGSFLYVSHAGFPIYTLHSKESHHTVHLPPGDYQCRSYNGKTYQTLFPLEIRPGQAKLQKFPELIPTVVEVLEGDLAPEFRQIKDWYGSSPMTLESLRGKVVILDFWGYWCGPCVYRMPELFELLEKYEDGGLVIIGVHDDTVKDAKELNEKLRPIRQYLWDGKTFLILSPSMEGASSPFLDATQMSEERQQPFMESRVGRRIYSSTAMVACVENFIPEILTMSNCSRNS